MSHRLVFLVALALMAIPALAEVPNRDKESLQRGASHIVIGKIQRVYRSTEKTGDEESTYGVAEVSVAEVEKGKGISEGDLVFVRFWNKRWVGKGPPPPGSAGHRGIPTKGDSCRVYVIRAKDQGFDVMLPNGFEDLKVKK